MLDRDLYVLVRRLCTQPPVSQGAIGAELGGLTRQRVQQMEARARKKAAKEGLTQADLEKVIMTAIVPEQVAA